MTKLHVVIGLGGAWSEAREARSAERLDALAEGSWFLGVLRYWLDLPVPAWNDSGAARVVWQWRLLNRELRVRLVGCVLVTAIVTNVGALIVLGGPAGRLPFAAWGIRGAIGLFAALLIVRPTAFPRLTR